MFSAVLFFKATDIGFKFCIKILGSTKELEGDIWGGTFGFCRPWHDFLGQSQMKMSPSCWKIIKAFWWRFFQFGELCHQFIWNETKISCCLTKQINGFLRIGVDHLECRIHGTCADGLDNKEMRKLPSLKINSWIMLVIWKYGFSVLPSSPFLCLATWLISRWFQS